MSVGVGGEEGIEGWSFVAVVDEEEGERCVVVWDGVVDGTGFGVYCVRAFGDVEYGLMGVSAFTIRLEFGDGCVRVFLRRFSRVR